MLETSGFVAARSVFLRPGRISVFGFGESPDLGEGYRLAAAAENVAVMLGHLLGVVATAPSFDEGADTSDGGV
jgi:hypothetical protein